MRSTACIAANIGWLSPGVAVTLYVDVTVTATGPVAGVAAVKPGGDPRLESAAKLCANDWRYRPATRNRKHVLCPQAATPANAEGTVTVSFAVATDGATKDIKVATSSGDADLDDATVKCVGRWRYRPMTNDGVPERLVRLEFLRDRIGLRRAERRHRLDDAMHR